MRRADACERTVRIALVGKYVQLADAYKSVVEALNHGGYHHGVNVEVELVNSEDLDQAALEATDGILIPGGFGERGIEGKIRAAQAAREQGIPFLGICLGMQMAVVEFARHVAGMDGANSAEFDPETPYPVIDLLPEQKEVTDMGGTMRLGADPIKLHDGTRAREIYGEAVIYQRHRHRYEVNNMLRRRLEDEGLVASGTSPDERLVEVIELPDHPFFVASQFHPEFKSRPTRPEPLFREFVGAAAQRAAERGPTAEPARARGGRSEAPVAGRLVDSLVRRHRAEFQPPCQARSVLSAVHARYRRRRELGAQGPGRSGRGGGDRAIRPGEHSSHAIPGARPGRPAGDDLRDRHQNEADAFGSVRLGRRSAKHIRSSGRARTSSELARRPTLGIGRRACPAVEPCRRLMDPPLSPSTRPPPSPSTPWPASPRASREGSGRARRRA